MRISVSYRRWDKNSLNLFGKNHAHSYRRNH